MKRLYAFLVPFFSSTLFAYFLALPSVYLIIPPKIVLNGAEISVSSTTPPVIAPKLPSKPLKPQNDPQAVYSYVLAQAKELGVNPLEVTWVVGHESQFGVNMLGDDGQSRGFWMISKIYHPEVTDQCANDLACSTDWSLHWILSGHIEQWSTFKFCREWYSDCPF